MIPLKVNLQSCLPTCTRSEAVTSHQEEGYHLAAGAQGREFKSSEEEPYYRARDSRSHTISSTDHVGENEMKRVLQKETAEDNDHVPSAISPCASKAILLQIRLSGKQSPNSLDKKTTKKWRKEESLPQTARLWV